jgi:hypothetical protein
MTRTSELADVAGATPVLALVLVVVVVVVLVLVALGVTVLVAVVVTAGLTGAVCGSRST